jgi:CubicO group peptidase (beta-lactamase class C family)
VRYSNYGAGLLGHVLARRAGKPYEELVAERVTRALGMTDTAVDVPAEKLERFAQGHNRRGRRVPHWEIPALAGAGALRSTVSDLLRFLEAQLGAAPSGLADAIRVTHEPRARRGPLEVGLGWMRLPEPGRRGTLVWHDGGTGGFRSVAGFVAESRTCVVALASSARSVDRIGLEILKAL